MLRKIASKYRSSFSSQKRLRDRNLSYASKYYDVNKVSKIRDRALQRKYGITLEQYNQLLADQGGVCAICRKEEQIFYIKRLGVDHNHETKQIRGLLCNNCNRALGLLKDDIKNVERLLWYLYVYLEEDEKSQ
jgi:hypothetical protein